MQSVADPRLLIFIGLNAGLGLILALTGFL